MVRGMNGFRLNVISTLAFTLCSFMALSSHAEEPSRSTLMEGCTQSQQACGNSGVSLGAIARDDRGHILRMNRAQAVAYCASRGGLPTAKQFALARNSIGVSDAELSGFQQVSFREESFYYNRANYQQPFDQEWNEWYWTTSSFNDEVGVAFGENHGEFAFINRLAPYPVRCLGE